MKAEFNRIDGRKLQALRRQRRFTQAKLAYAAKVTSPHISRLENGRHTAHDGTLEQLAYALGVDPEDLLASSEDGDGAPDSMPLASLSA